MSRRLIGSMTMVMPCTTASPAARRACLGELIQIDGSEHPWFEKRASQCTLLGVRGRYDEPAAFEFGGSDAS